MGLPSPSAPLLDPPHAATVASDLACAIAPPSPDPAASSPPASDLRLRGVLPVIPPSWSRAARAAIGEGERGGVAPRPPLYLARE